MGRRAGKMGKNEERRTGVDAAGENSAIMGSGTLFFSRWTTGPGQKLANKRKRSI